MKTYGKRWITHGYERGKDWRERQVLKSRERYARDSKARGEVRAAVERVKNAHSCETS